MGHGYEDEIKCPYCNYEFTDSWEYNEYDVTITCEDCDKDFSLSIEISVKYSTSRMDCGNLKPPEDHRYGKPYKNEYDQETCDRWNRANFLNRNNHKPKMSWKRDCRKCDHTESRINMEIGAECPWGRE